MSQLKPLENELSKRLRFLELACRVSRTTDAYLNEDILLEHIQRAAHLPAHPECFIAEACKLLRRRLPLSFLPAPFRLISFTLFAGIVIAMKGFPPKFLRDTCIGGVTLLR